MAQSKAYDSNAGQWPEFSGFAPLELEKHEFRVLRLDSSSSRISSKNEEEYLRYTMHHKEVVPQTRYTALSYSWGAPVPCNALKAIIIEDQLVRIRPTLHAFLRTLAAHDPTIDLWIDAVCINQTDTEERNQQISMMGRIFSTAQKVYVWLGVGDDDTNYAFEHMEHVDGTSAAVRTTAYDERQFAPCAEKIFRSSYWTRRWVIQEFALARQLYIVCGAYVSPWPRVAKRINEDVLKDDQRALQVLENFKQLKVLGAQQNLSLLDLMLRFQDSRCIDRRDKAFALRGIAKDGKHFQPDYKESVTDVFFRTLSMMPTEKVLPAMTGYRWPHANAVRLQQCLRMTKDDVLSSLKGKCSDKLFVSFEYMGEVRWVNNRQGANDESIFTKSVSIKEQEDMILFGTTTIHVGDILYRLQSLRSSPPGLVIAVRARESIYTVVAIGLDMSNSKTQTISNHMKSFVMIQKIARRSIAMCSRNELAQPPQARALFHINRIAFTMLWLLEEGYVADLLDCYEATLLQSEDHVSCTCLLADTDTAKCITTGSKDIESHLEVMPFLEDGSGELVNHPAGGIWLRRESSPNEKPTSLESFLDEEYERREDEYWDPGRDNLSFAAGDGLALWTSHYLSLNAPQTADYKSRNPLSWAIQSGRTKTAEILITSPNFDYKLEDRKGISPLRYALSCADTTILQMMLAREDFDPNWMGTSSRPPISWATQLGRNDMVKVLLSAHRIDPDIHESDGHTALLWAGICGNEEAGLLLLETNRVDYNRQDLNKRAILSYAAEKNLRRIMKILLEKDDIEPDVIDGQRVSPLRHAFDQGNMEIVKMLAATGKVETRLSTLKNGVAGWVELG